MLKIKDNVDLKELEKYGLKPIYKITDDETGKVEVVGYKSNKYCCRWGYLLFKMGKKPHYKILNISCNRNISNYIEEKIYEYQDSSFIDADLLYDLIKANLVEKVEE